MLTCSESNSHLSGAGAVGLLQVPPARVVVVERELGERPQHGPLLDLLEAVAVHAKVVRQTLLLLGPELLKRVPAALGKLKAL
jgi:hypothetical protein